MNAKPVSILLQSRYVSRGITEAGERSYLQLLRYCKIFTGVDEDKLRKDFAIPQELEVTAFACFGYPSRNITGLKKNRNPLGEIAFSEKFVNRFDPEPLRGRGWES